MIIESPKFRLELLRTQGEVLEMIATYGPGSKPPPRHFHPSQVERFEVKSGALMFELNGTNHLLRAGNSLTVPSYAIHSARNASEVEEAVVHWETRPALRSAQFFEAVHNLNKSGPTLLGRAALAREFKNEFVLASPPRVVQSCVFGLLAPIARVLGKGPKYSIKA